MERDALRAAENFWLHTACGETLANETLEALQQAENVLICSASPLPWPKTFHSLLSGRCVSPDRSFALLDAAGIPDPGRYLFTEYCSEKARRTYWPENGRQYYPEFIARTKDSRLHHRFVAVSGIGGAEALGAWLRFAEAYTQETIRLGVSPRAVFLLEYAGDRGPGEARGMRRLRFSPGRMDVYAFNLRNTAALSFPYEVSAYAAELISSLAGGDFELAGSLAEDRQTLRELLYDPKKRFRSLAGDALSAEQLNTKIQDAQLRTLFPLLEDRRRRFIETYRDAIERSGVLPFESDYGEVKKDPLDLELRDLLANARRIGVEESDNRQIYALKEIRNHLAHSRVLTADEVGCLLDFTIA